MIVTTSNKSCGYTNLRTAGLVEPKGDSTFFYFGQSPREVSEESEFHLIGMKTVIITARRIKNEIKADEIDIRYDWYSTVEPSN